jgi:PAS domain S-box-containing protein
MKKDQANKTAEFRKEAEARARDQNIVAPETGIKDSQWLIEELRIHQIELEMQNEELRSIQVQLEESRTKYSDLYDFAPVGYLVLDKPGIVREANLTAASQLGVERSRLINTPFQFYIATRTDRTIFRSHCNKVFDGDERATCEIRLKRGKGVEFYALIDSIAMQDFKGSKLSRTSISDITERKRAEEELQKSHNELENQVRERTAELRSANEQLQREIQECTRMEEENRYLSRRLMELAEGQSKRLAQNLHDEFGQNLTALLYRIEGLRESLPGELNDVKEECSGVMNLIEHMGESIRNISFSLRPDMLDHLGLISTLEWYADKFSNTYRNMEVDFQVTGQVKRLSPEKEITLYRILQEGLSNIAKHAEAGHVRLLLAYGRSQVGLTIKDDGVGFDQRRDMAPNKENRPGIGLLGIRERINSLDGTVKIQSGRGKGTMVSVKLPINEVDKRDG